MFMQAGAHWLEGVNTTASAADLDVAVNDAHRVDVPEHTPLHAQPRVQDALLEGFDKLTTPAQDLLQPHSILNTGREPSVIPLAERTHPSVL